MPDQDVRLQHLKTWLDEQLEKLFQARQWGAVPPATLTAASSDASFRRYFRWQGQGRSFIVMDAPPPQENCAPFVKIDELLASARELLRSRFRIDHSTIQVERQAPEDCVDC